MNIQTDNLMYQYTAAPVLGKNIYLYHLHLFIYFPSNSIVQLLINVF